MHQEYGDCFQHLNGYTFSGSKLNIERLDSSYDETRNAEFAGQNTKSAATETTKDVLFRFLQRRYVPEEQCLHFEAYGEDEILKAIGIFNAATTKAKFFPALMKICDEIWDTPEKKVEGVTSVRLGNNKLSSVLEITTLAVTFPRLKNLDLANNDLTSIESLKHWRWKFRDLELLILSGNALAAEPGIEETMRKWFPKLKLYNGTEGRPEQEFRAVERRPLVMAASFRDEHDIAVNFLTEFFPLFDSNRESLVAKFYDSESRYSMSVNNKIKRVQRDAAKHPDWKPFLRQSRDLLSITHLHARSSRSFKGQSEILEEWKSLPATQHPSLESNPRGWVIECHPIRGLDDPTGTTLGGVSGLVIMVHGDFTNMDQREGWVTKSFDRTFILGPGNGLGGIRVVCDMVVLRPHNRTISWNVTEESTYETVTHAYERPAHPEASGKTYGLPDPLKSQETLVEERVVLDFCHKIFLQHQKWIRLKIAYDCLKATGGDQEQAYQTLWRALDETRELPPDDAFYNP